eukprot:gene23556-26881_t
MEQLIKTTTAMMTDAMVAEDGTTNGDMVMSLARILMGEMKTLQKSFTEAQIASLLRAEDVVLIQEMLDETMRNYNEVMETLTIAAKKIQKEKQISAAKEAEKAAGGSSGAADAMWSREALADKRIKVLRKLLKDEFGAKCDGCTEKLQFIDMIVELRASDEGSTKDEL